MSKLEELIDNLWPKSIKFMYLYQLEEKKYNNIRQRKYY